MEPSIKNPAIDNLITSITGINRKDSITSNTCVFCKAVVTKEDFKNPLDLKEFTISGICPKCQKNIFG